jgi:ABC-type transport system involved in multi-copper enzyme maturation permease subunit
MRNPVRPPLVAIFQAEVLLNTKRVAPYAMAVLFGGNALLWWGWGPAAGRGWATNSDAFIADVLPIFSFLTLPLFTALLMADPVIRDFRAGIAPLIFSKPISRAEYLLGKFAGNFFVLVCCQATFVLTLFVLQAFRRPGMIVQDARALPYVKHFLVFVVISHLVLAAVYFTVGTLTRNAKIVYFLGVCFYPLYIAYQSFLLKSLPLSWRAVLDPLLMNWGSKASGERSAEWMNQLKVAYDLDLIANRASMILIAGACLVILYLRFAIAERPTKAEPLSTLSLSTAADEVFYDSESFGESRHHVQPVSSDPREVDNVALPAANYQSSGFVASVNKLRAALVVEFRLLRSERSLVLVLPLAMVISFLSLPFEVSVSGEGFSAAFASSTANGLLLFLLGVIVFYTGEVFHRDRELRVEPLLWSTPIPNIVLLVSKFLTTMSLATGLIAVAGLTAITTQLLRGHTPVDIFPYLLVYSVILLPTIVFMTAGTIALNVLLQDKYLAYATCIAITGGAFYLYSRGHNHWLYNPSLYQLWNYADLAGPSGSGNVSGRMLLQRIYCLALSGICLTVAHLGYQRKSPRGFMIDRRLGSRGWALLLLCVSGLIAIAAGLMVK